MKSLLLGLAMLGFSANAFAVWGPEEIRESAEAAFDSFSAEFGATLYDNIIGLSVKLTPQKNSAKVEILYEDSGVEKFEKLFCHQHGADIDCH